jgi:CheY-like chemotaxis protein
MEKPASNLSKNKTVSQRITIFLECNICNEYFYHVIFMDLIMSEMDGLETSIRILNFVSEVKQK